MTKMLITKQMLKEKGACAEQVRIFAKEWPEGAVVNLKNIRRACNLPIDTLWFALAFLSDPAWKLYINPKRDELEGLVASCKKMGWLK